MNSWMFRRVLVFMSCEDSTNHAIISLLTDCWSSLTQEWLLSMRQSIPDLPLCWHQRIGRNVREKTRPATIAMNRNNERVINRFEPRFDFTWKSWWNRDFREMSCCSVDWLYTQYMHANMQPSTEYRVPRTETRLQTTIMFGRSRLVYEWISNDSSHFLLITSLFFVHAPRASLRKPNRGSGWCYSSENNKRHILNTRWKVLRCYSSFNCSSVSPVNSNCNPISKHSHLCVWWTIIITQELICSAEIFYCTLAAMYLRPLNVPACRDLSAFCWAGVWIKPS